MPGIPNDETERAWYTAFMARFNARVIPSFRIDAELATRVDGPGVPTLSSSLTTYLDDVIFRACK